MCARLRVRARARTRSRTAHWAQVCVRARTNTHVCVCARVCVCGGGAGERAQAVADARDLGVALAARVAKVIESLVSQGVLQECVDGADGERRVRYLREGQPRNLVAPKRARGRPTGSAASRAGAGGWSVFEEKNQGVQSQHHLEQQFHDFFGKCVSEWNPCRDDQGRWRYRWDAEVGAYDVEGLLDEDLTAEGKAVRDVPATAPELVNLRSLLDRVYAAEGDDAACLDVQRIRRLVAMLVQRVERHTLHGEGTPRAKDPCARGKDNCMYCRYGFPLELQCRCGDRPLRLEKGDREGQWYARFPRNDRLCCSYEEHVLLANSGNVDWRPCLNLWAVVQYVTKYATKAPKGSRRVHDVLKDAVDEVCQYVPDGEGADFLRRAIKKFFSRTMGERDYGAFEAV